MSNGQHSLALKTNKKVAKFNSWKALSTLLFFVSIYVSHGRRNNAVSNYGRENRDTECYTEAMSHDSLENKETSLVLDKREKTRGKEKSPNINLHNNMPKQDCQQTLRKKMF